VRRSQTISYIEVALDDIEQANRLAHEVLGRSLDELPPQTRKLLQLVEDMVSTECERLNEKKQGTRLLKIACPACGYTARDPPMDRPRPAHLSLRNAHGFGGVEPRRASVHCVADAPARPHAAELLDSLRQVEGRRVQIASYTMSVIRSCNPAAVALRASLRQLSDNEELCNRRRPAPAAEYLMKSKQRRARSRARRCA
jgi:hypothetical protein